MPSPSFKELKERFDKIKSQRIIIPKTQIELEELAKDLLEYYKYVESVKKYDFRSRRKRKKSRKRTAKK